MDRRHGYGVYGDFGDVVAHCSLGAESYYVLRHTFYFFTLGTSPASIDPAHFRRAGYGRCRHSGSAASTAASPIVCLGGGHVDCQPGP
jgi:hypothetical protein